MKRSIIEDIDIRRNVSDFACIIEPGYEQKIDRVIAVIEARTTAEIAVVTLESLEGISIDDAAYRLFNKFGIGKKEINNGVLLLISTKDGSFRFELGLGLENIIESRMSKALVEKIMSPGFRSEHFGPTILRFLRRVSHRITRSRMSNLSLISWLSGILSLIFTAAGVFSSLVVALSSFPDIDRPVVLLSLFAKTCIPAALLSLAAIITAIVDLSLETAGIKGGKKLISRSIAGQVLGAAALIFLFLAFLFFPALSDFIAGVISLPSSGY